MRGAVCCLLLATLVSAGEPDFKQVYDPLDAAWPVKGDRRGARRNAFEAAVARRGLDAAIKHMAGFEDAIEDLQKVIDRDAKTYAKHADKWWSWRRAYIKSYEKKHGRPPAEFPTPEGINKPFLDSELQFKASRALKLKERLFHRWVVERLGELIEKSDDKPLSAILAGLKNRNHHQQLRCATLLSHAPDEATVRAAVERASHPAVVARLLAIRGDPAYLTHAAWTVRAGAVCGLTEAAPLIEALAREKGRLRDDATDRLRTLTGQEIGSDPDAWRQWTGTPQPRKVEPDRTSAPGVFSDGKLTCFGIPSSSRAVVYCIEASSKDLFDHLRGEVVRSIQSLPDGAQFGIVVYGAEAKPWRKKMAHCDAGTRADAKAFLEKHEAGAGANLYEGLMAALELAGGSKKSAADADTIFLAAINGQAGGLYEDKYQVTLEALHTNELRGIRIHAFGPSDGGDSYYLQELCNQFGGTHKG